MKWSLSSVKVYKVETSEVVIAFRVAATDLKRNGRWLNTDTRKLQMLAECNGFRRGHFGCNGRLMTSKRLLMMKTRWMWKERWKQMATYPPRLQLLNLLFILTATRRVIDISKSNPPIKARHIHNFNLA